MYTILTPHIIIINKYYYIILYYIILYYIILYYIILYYTICSHTMHIIQRHFINSMFFHSKPRIHPKAIIAKEVHSARGDAFGATLTTAQRNAGDGDAVGDSTNIVP